MKTFSVAVIAGDGIGKEVVPEGIRVLEAAGKRFGFQFRWQEFDWSCETYVKTGKMMPPDGLKQLRPFDAIFWELWGIRALRITFALGIIDPNPAYLPAIRESEPVRLLRELRRR